jgi:hypothetical protein
MKRLLFALLLVAGSGAGVAHAGLDIDFGASINIGDDDGLFLSISARYFDQDRPAVDRIAARYRNPDDLAVVLFVARRSGRSVDRIHEMRSRGLSWWDVSVRVGLPMDVWFVPVDRDPGPPYGKAYGHWKNHRRDNHHAAVLTDADARNLVAVRMLHEYYGVSVAVAMDWRSSGHDLRALVSTEYGKRHGHKHKVAKNHDKPKSKGKGHGKHKR